MGKLILPPTVQTKVTLKLTELQCKQLLLILAAWVNTQPRPTGDKMGAKHAFAIELFMEIKEKIGLGSEYNKVIKNT